MPISGQGANLALVCKSNAYPILSLGCRWALRSTPSARALMVVPCVLLKATIQSRIQNPALNYGGAGKEGTYATGSYQDKPDVSTHPTANETSTGYADTRPYALYSSSKVKYTNLTLSGSLAPPASRSGYMGRYT